MGNCLIRSINQPFSVDDNEVHVGASVGVETYNETACDAETDASSREDIASILRKGRRMEELIVSFPRLMNEEWRLRVTLTDAKSRSAISSADSYF